MLLRSLPNRTLLTSLALSGLISAFLFACGSDEPDAVTTGTGGGKSSAGATSSAGAKAGGATSKGGTGATAGASTGKGGSSGSSGNANNGGTAQAGAATNGGTVSTSGAGGTIQGGGTTGVGQGGSTAGSGQGGASAGVAGRGLAGTAGSAGSGPVVCKGGTPVQPLVQTGVPCNLGPTCVLTGRSCICSALTMQWVCVPTVVGVGGAGGAIASAGAAGLYAIQNCTGVQNNEACSDFGVGLVCDRRTSAGDPRLCTCTSGGSNGGAGNIPDPHFVCVSLGTAGAAGSN